MTGPVEGRIPFRGHETWYRIVGDGPGVPLLCLHGGPGSTHIGLAALEALADERPVVIYDQLGSGNSSKPSDPSLWTVALFAAELANVREALTLDRVHLFGHSWGGMLAQEYALGQPDGLASLVLSSTLSSAALWREEALRLRAALPAEIGETLDAHEQAGTTDDPAYEKAMRDGAILPSLHNAAFKPDLQPTLKAAIVAELLTLRELMPVARSATR